MTDLIDPEIQRDAAGHRGDAPGESARPAGSEAGPDAAPGGPAGGGDGGEVGSKWWTLAAVCTGVFMLLLDITIVNVALSDIQRDLDASLSDLQWVIDAYALSLAALLLTAGSLADLFGRRRVFLIGLVVFTAGSTACGLAQSVHFLWASRAFQGIGGAAMFATALALLANAFRGKERGVAFGVFGATTGIAVAVGPVLGGVLTSYLSWRWIFWVNIPIGIIAFFLVLAKVAESKQTAAGSPDWAGFLSFSGALGTFVYGLIESGKVGWGSDRVILSMIAAGFLLVVFVTIEIGARYPMFDLSLLKKPTFVGGLIAAFAVSATIFSLLTYLVIYVQNVLGYSPVAAGVRFLFLSGASFFVAAAAGRLTEKLPIKWLIAPGFLITGIGLFLLTGIAKTDDPGQWTHLIAGLTVAGFGIGMINPPLASTAVGVVSVERSGMASGVNSTFRQVGIATGIAALGSIFAHEIADKVSAGLKGTPVASQSSSIADAITGGQTQAVLAKAPASSRPQIEQAATTAFVDALNHIVLIGSIGCFVAAVLTFVLIRQKDFVAHGAPEPGAASEGAADADRSPGGTEPDEAARATPVGAGAGASADSTGPAHARQDLPESTSPELASSPAPAPLSEPEPEARGGRATVRYAAATR